MKHIATNPRCKLCAAPFGGPGGAVLKHFGYARFAGNPAMCDKCITQFRRSGVAGTEIPVTLLSTTSAEAAARDTAGAERRTLDLRGRQEPIEVVAIRP